MSFSARLLAWHARHGRTNLPWQQQPTPYRVWVSEIMLQQTRVATVIPYYQRFMKRFPELADLAAASQDEVLVLWSGLGYYSRARNLLQCAQQIAAEYRGEFPHEQDVLMSLPGIGRSTAAAILALSAGRRHAILDGNVKRVLARFHAVEGWPGRAVVQRQLWHLAEQHTPAENVAAYTQAIMDLGATLCTRQRPRCVECPQQFECAACQRNETGLYPAPRPRRTLPVKQAKLLLVSNERDELLFEQRPPSGIWGGLWSLPEPGSCSLPEWCEEQGLELLAMTSWPLMRHSFSHFHLDIYPLHLRIREKNHKILEAGGTVWYKPELSGQLGLPAPIRTLVERLVHTE